MHRRPRLSGRVMHIALLVAALTPGPVAAQEEFPPPSGKESGGKAPLVVVFSGATGPGNYRAMAGRIAALGYDVALFDSNAVMKAQRRARELDAAAKAVAAPFELTVYPGVRHGFNLRGTDYDAPSTDDAFAKTAPALARHLGRQDERHLGMLGRTLAIPLCQL